MAGEGLAFYHNAPCRAISANSPVVESTLKNNEFQGLKIKNGGILIFLKRFSE